MMMDDTGMGRIEASIMGESALIDRESGRVYWEGRSSNTLYESLAPKLDQFGAEHAQATVLTLVITLAFLGVLAGWLRRVIDSYYLSSMASSSASSSSWIGSTLFSQSQIISILITAIEWTIMKVPRIHNKWLILASVILYFLECYNCSTRRFLTNVYSSSSDLDTYIESLRHEQPIVTWTVRAYHYEMRRIFTITRFLQSISRKLQGLSESSDVTDSTSLVNRRQHTSPMFPFTRKVITNEGKTTYRYASCIDSTIAGVWTRAVSSSGSHNPVAPFTKITLNKLLVLTDRRSREDYFRQQSDFVTQHGRGDEFVEFSTDIEVTGYRPRVLAVRQKPSSATTNNNHNISNVSNQKRRSGSLPLLLFWFFSICGLTVPYRIWFKRHCDFVRVTLVKETSAVPSSAGNSLATSYWETAKSWFPSSSSLSLSRQVIPKMPTGVGETIFGPVLADPPTVVDTALQTNVTQPMAIESASKNIVEKPSQTDVNQQFPIVEGGAEKDFTANSGQSIAVANSDDERSSMSTTSLMNDP